LITIRHKFSEQPSTQLIFCIR